MVEDSSQSKGSDERDMSDFGEGKWIKTRKEGKCLYCLGRVPKGEDVYHYKGRYDNEWQDYKLHSECWDDIGQSSYGGQWEFSAGDGEIPERLKSLDGCNQITLGALGITKEEIKLQVQTIEINNRAEYEEEERVWTLPLEDVKKSIPLNSPQNVPRSS